jgi:hypothetical protein
MPKDKLDSKQPGFVIPVCCVVLERESSRVPQLARLANTDCALSEYIAFKDDARFEKQRVAVLAALAQVPAYQLTYDSDPASAAPFLRELLARHDLQGADQRDGS